MKIKQVLIGLGMIASLNIPKPSLAQVLSGEYCIENECYSYSVTNTKAPNLSKDQVMWIGNKMRNILLQTNNARAIHQQYFNDGIYQGVILTFYDRQFDGKSYKAIKVILTNEKRIILGVEKHCNYSVPCQALKQDAYFKEFQLANPFSAIR